MKKALVFPIFLVLLSVLNFSAAAAPANDDFANSDQVSGTNITYSGNFDGATLEPGEPQPNDTNTVWMSWEAPATGYAQVVIGRAPQFQYYAVFTGLSVTNLRPVALTPLGANSIFRFVVTAGTVYHFQFSGGADNFTFYLQFYPFGPCINDDFADAILVKGIYTVLGPDSMLGATMEPGEPLLLGAMPQGSLWWKWQAPNWGIYQLYPYTSLATNWVMAIYTGNSVDALSPLAESTAPYFTFTAQGGQTYYISAVFPTNQIGDIFSDLSIGRPDYSVHPVPGNILQEPSWEGTGILNAQYWKWSNSLGGWVDESTGGADGETWPTLGGQTGIWQDIPTTPGHTYTIKYAYQINPTDGSGGDAVVTVWWSGNQIGVSDVPAGEQGWWHWDTYSVIASNTTSRFACVNLGRNMDMDAFSVVDATAPPAIVKQPASTSSTGGGTVKLDVTAAGSLPLAYQWYFNSAPIGEQTNQSLVMNSVTTNQIGNYYVTVTNNYGAVTSAVASVEVNAPVGATILVQPYGDTVPVGGYFNFAVVAATSMPPLSYQWYFNGSAISGATNQIYALDNIQMTNAGVYTVQVQDQSSTAFSFPATLVVDTNALGGGTINFANWFITDETNAFPVFDIDGSTPLNGGNYLAQLYAGPSLDLLRPAGQPSPFQSGYNAGYFVPETITLGNVAPGSNAVVQVRAWDSSAGISFEAARALGGRFGESQIFQVTAGSSGFPSVLQGLQSFSLQAGLPYFEVATIQFVQLQPPNTIVWSLQGQAGYIYAIEKSAGPPQSVWQPFITVTNETGTVQFSDTENSGSAVVLYRARILN